MTTIKSITKAQLLVKFRKFLSRNKALKAFTENLKGEDIETVKGLVEYIVKRGDLDSLVAAGFIWRGTEEGLCFWATISIKWREAARKVIVAEPLNLKVGDKVRLKFGIEADAKYDNLVMHKVMMFLDTKEVTYKSDNDIALLDDTFYYPDCVLEVVERAPEFKLEEGCKVRLKDSVKVDDKALGFVLYDGMVFKSPMKVTEYHHHDDSYCRLENDYYYPAGWLEVVEAAPEFKLEEVVKEEDIVPVESITLPEEADRPYSYGAIVFHDRGLISVDGNPIVRISDNFTGERDSEPMSVWIEKRPDFDKIWHTDKDGRIGNGEQLVFIRRKKAMYEVAFAINTSGGIVEMAEMGKDISLEEFKLKHFGYNVEVKEFELTY